MRAGRKCSAKKKVQSGGVQEQGPSSSPHITGQVHTRDQGTQTTSRYVLDADGSSPSIL